ncbi:MAG: hypothetical protein K0R69_1842 [Clostridia bacterium]|nr:hypothetical protein [Clostridia bacterium]
MTRLRKTINLGVMTLAIGVVSITAFAASNYNTPAEVVAGLTGKTVESVIAEKSETGETYGSIASKNGKLTEFKAKMIENKKNALAERVTSGTITQEKADEMIAALEENQQGCDGTGANRIGQIQGASFGCMNGSSGKGNFKNKF